MAEVQTNLRVLKPSRRASVDDDGTLILLAGDVEVVRLSPENWVTVDRVGQPLSPTWPPKDLALLLDRLDDIVIRRWGNYESVGSPEEYQSPALNETDALLDRIAERINRDPYSTDSSDRRLLAELREAIVRHFQPRT